VIRDGLAWAKAGYDSMHGPIASHWRLDGTRLTLGVTIPPNTTATVRVPAKDPAGVTESGTPAAQADGVRFLRSEHGSAVFEVGSGAYRFQSIVSPSK